LNLYFFYSSARTLNFNHDEHQIESDGRSNDQQRREIILRKLSSPFGTKRLLTNHFTNEHFMPMTRHAKAIIKGDPREFMG